MNDPNNSPITIVILLLLGMGFGGVVNFLLNKKSEAAMPNPAPPTPLPPPVVDNTVPEKKAEQATQVVIEDAQKKIDESKATVEKQNEVAKEAGVSAVADLLNDLDRSLVAGTNSAQPSGDPTSSK